MKGAASQVALFTVLFTCLAMIDALIHHPYLVKLISTTYPEACCMTFNEIIVDFHLQCRVAFSERAWRVRIQSS